MWLFKVKMYKYIKYVVVAAYIYYCIVRYSIMAVSLTV
jgi:hypothetical protein